MTHGLTIGACISLPAAALGLGVPDDAPRVDYQVVAVDANSFTLSTTQAIRDRSEFNAARLAADLERENRRLPIAQVKTSPHVPPWARKRGKR